MKILITGGKGFIGQYLGVSLHNSSAEVIAPGREELDLTNSNQVAMWMGLHKPDVIVHLAACPTNKPDKNNPNKIIDDNILSTHNVCFHAPQGCRVIFASTISVYGKTTYPVHETDPKNPTTMYGVSKLCGEKIVSLYTQLGQINGVSLRFCAIVGSGMTHGMLHDWFKKIKLDTNELEVFGSRPGSIKPFLHIDDAVAALKFMIKNQYITYPVNICPDEMLSVEDVANILIESRHLPKKIKWLGDDVVWAGDVNVLQASNTLMKSIGIPCFNRTSFDAVYAAIRETP